MEGILLNLLSSAIFSTVAGVATYIWQQRRILEYQKRIDVSKLGDSYEVVLLLCCRNDIENAVKSKYEQLGIQPKKLIKVYRKEDLTEREEDWMLYVKQIRAQVQEIRTLGVDIIHVFANTPIAIALFAGALLNNGPKVYVYQYFGGEYHRVGVLSNQTVHM